MKKKILRVILSIVLLLMFVLCVILCVQVYFMQSKIFEGNRAAGELIGSASGAAMRDQAGGYLMETSAKSARISDASFSKIKGAAEIIAHNVEDIYAHPDRYGTASFGTYDDDDIGQLVTYVAYGDDTDTKSESVKRETEMLANLQGVLSSVRSASDLISVTCFASETGLFVCAEPVSEYNLPVGNNPLYFEARQRPWYLEAVSKGEAVFTDIIMDADTGECAVSCGVPVYLDGELIGVVGSGMRLESLREDVDRFHVGEQGYACIINESGQVLFSGAKEGSLAPTTDFGSGLIDDSDEDLAGLVGEAIKGGTGYELITLDDVPCYVAYAPMETVGWSYLVVLPESEVLKPSEELVDQLNIYVEDQTEFVRRSIFTSVLTFLIILAAMIAVACLAAARFSDRLSRPIVALTEQVSRIDGENLDFKWDRDTGDEVQVLAETFSSMTGRMQDYISDITTITADKERIRTELTMATQIQESMLPHDFPPFPERPEFDIFAVMDPAREVGGDFYDFFMIDDDHLGLVMADVSGKGIPAALFMMVSKIIVQSCAMLGRSASGTLEKTNEALCSNNQTDMFVTVWFGILEISTGIMSTSNAGHEYPAIKRANGSFELYHDKHGFVIGGLDDMRYQEYQLELKPGDRLFLYTDGLTEASKADNQMFGTERMLESLNRDPRADIRELLANVRSDVDEFVDGAEQFDDMTMLCLEYRGPVTDQT